MKTTIAILSLGFLQAAFYAITLYQNPTDGMAAYYFAWVLLPATVAALAFLPRFHFVAAVSSAIVSTLLFDFLFLQYGYFWPERPKESPYLAVVYVVMGAGLAFIVAGFVHSVIKRLERERLAKKSTRLMIAARKGFVFSSIWAFVAFPFCTMAVPVGTGVISNPAYAFASVFAACLILAGTVISVVAGLLYDPAKCQLNEAG